jgi:outer membrane scaffolding protein for murein synthesis (MipA/OmpV family)
VVLHCSVLEVKPKNMYKLHLSLLAGVAGRWYKPVCHSTYFGVNKHREEGASGLKEYDGTIGRLHLDIPYL